MGLALLAGCKDDDDDDGPGGGTLWGPDSNSSVEFLDDFSGPFPSPNWKIKSGEPFASPHVGNVAPGLALLAFETKARVRSTFTFSTSGPLTLSFDLANPAWEWNSRFKFRIRESDDDDAGEASFEIRLHEREIRLRIEGSYAEFDYKSDGEYHAVEFTIDSDGAATWRLDGQALLSRVGFPGGDVEIEMEVTGNSGTKFVVDNVILTRP